MIGFCVFTIACAPEQTLPEGALDPVKIGVVTSLSGALGTDGPRWADASRLAAQELNAAGGPLPGRPIELVVVDDETNAELGRQIADDLIAEGAVAIVGGAASSVSLELAAVATPAGVPQISCCATSDLLTGFNAEAADEAQRYFFRTIPPDGLQSVAVAIAAERLSCTRLAILHLDDGYGDPFGRGIETEFASASAEGSVVARVPFTGGRPSYMAEVAQVRDATPDCVALVAFPASAGRILRDWAALGVTSPVTWIGTDGVRSPGFIEEVGDPALVDGFYGTSPITDPATPEYNDFRARYRAVFGEPPIPFSSNQYDAVALIGLAIAAAGSTDGAAIRDALREVSSPEGGLVSAAALAEGLAELREGRDIDYLGASGDTDFDAFGNVVTPYEIWRYDQPGSDTPCPGEASPAPAAGRFCRFETLLAEEIQQ